MPISKRTTRWMGSYYKKKEDYHVKKEDMTNEELNKLVATTGHKAEQ